MIIKDDKEGNKIIASNLKYNPIYEQMDIMNRRRTNMNVKVIDERIKENDQSYQNVDNTTCQGAKISLFINTKHEITVTRISKIPTPISLHDSISSIQETKA